MALKGRTVRLDDATWGLVERRAEADGVPVAQLLARTIREAVESWENCIEPDGNRDVLTQQLAVKDEQIARLMDALEAAQDATKAAQALHAQAAQRQAIEPRTGRLQRFRQFLRGE